MGLVPSSVKVLGNIGGFLQNLTVAYFSKVLKSNPLECQDVSTRFSYSYFKKKKNSGPNTLK